MPILRELAGEGRGILPKMGPNDPLPGDPGEPAPRPLEATENHSNPTLTAV